MGGADGKTPELRPPSIKGALRFWWRAVHGDLNLSQLKEKEKKIFGGVGAGENSSQQSSFSIRVIHLIHQTIEKETKKPVPNKAFEAEALHGSFTLELALKPNAPITSTQLKSLFILTTLLGGFGKRSRRGMGVVVIEEIDEQPCEVRTLHDIYLCLQSIYDKDKYEFQKDCIKPKFQSQSNFPFIQKIKVGKSEKSDLTQKIAQVAHNINKKFKHQYGTAMGMANPRFASPVYVSIIHGKEGLIPVITTLNAVTPNSKKADTSIQSEFKSEILK